MDCKCNKENQEIGIDQGPMPFTTNMMQMAMQNRNFRTAVWTGEKLQWTVMSIPPCGEIGVELHPDTDQLLRVEAGQGLVTIGKRKEQMNFRQNLRVGDAVFIPCGMWHNVVNTGKHFLKLSSIYAPPHHPRGTVQE